MYQWTHTSRLQPNGNGPKTDYDEKVQIQSDHEESNYYNNNSTVIVVSQERGETFATVKNKLLLCETIATKTSSSDTENQAESNQTCSLNPIENGELQHCPVEEAQIGGDEMDGHLKNDENLQQDCDMVDKKFVEISTQTDDTKLDILKDKQAEDLQTRPAPPPPPMPSPLAPPLPPSICIVSPSDATDNKSINEKPIITESLPVTSHQTNSQINISSTKLSSASSFCPPPPPPMNGVPGPPPLPLPTGNIWFKSDSKCSN